MSFWQTSDHMLFEFPHKRWDPRHTSRQPPRWRGYLGVWLSVPDFSRRNLGKNEWPATRPLQSKNRVGPLVIRRYPGKWIVIERLDEELAETVGICANAQKRAGKLFRERPTGNDVKCPAGQQPQFHKISQKYRENPKATGFAASRLSLLQSQRRSSEDPANVVGVGEQLVHASSSYAADHAIFRAIARREDSQSLRISLQEDLRLAYFNRRAWPRQSQRRQDAKAPGGYRRRG